MRTIFSCEFKALGTEVKIFLVAEEKEMEKKAAIVFGEIEKIYEQKEKTLSRFDEESELSKLNTKLNIFSEVSSDILHLSQASLKYNNESEGYFDPRIIESLENVGYKKDFKANVFSKHKVQSSKFFPKNKLSEDLKIENGQVFFGKRMDFSGIAKGYITDLISAYLERAGFKNFLIDSGGDIFAKGRNEDDEKWRVEIEGIPEEKIILHLENSGAATSGITRRKWEAEGKKYHHLINPISPDEFSFDLKSVTVIDLKCERADVLAKVLYLMGRKRGMEYAKKKKIAAIFLDYRGNIFLSQKFKENQIISSN